MDIGKTHHRCVVLDQTGQRLLSRRVADDEPDLLDLFADVVALGEETVWSVDVADGTAALLINVLLDQARTRTDLAVPHPEDELIAELRVLTHRRADLTSDRTRRTNQLRGMLTGPFPALERARHHSDTVLDPHGRHPPPSRRHASNTATTTPDHLVDTRRPLRPAGAGAVRPGRRPAKASLLVKGLSAVRRGRRRT